MPRHRPRLWITLYTVALTMLLVRLPRLGDPQDLDCGWQGMLHQDWLDGARSGIDTIFTYGPLGWLWAQAVFTADGQWPRTLLGLAAAFALALALTSVRDHLPPRWRTAWLVLMLALAPYGEGFAVFVAIAAAGTSLALAPQPLVARRPLRTAGCLLLFAAVALSKFTWLAFASSSVAVLVAIAALGRWWQSALALPLLYGTFAVALWLLFGQHIGDLGAWWHGSLEIAAGYNDVMGSAREASEVQWAAIVLVIDAVLAAALLGLAVADWRTRRKADPAAAPWSALAPHLGASAIVVGGLAVAWKAGFVRHDESHSVMFFGYATAAPLLLLAANGVRALPRMVTAFAVGAVLAAGWPAVDAALRIPNSAPLAEAAARIGDVATLPGFVAQLRDDIVAQRAATRLPRLRTRMRDAAVDVMGYRQGIALAAGMSLRHRPVFQGYSAYTPWLDAANGAFLRGDAAPPFVLVAVEAIGGRLPMTEDSDAWRALLDGYQPIDCERDYLLLERTSKAPPPMVPLPARRVLDRRAKFGEWVEVPATDDRHELALDLAYSARGRALGMLLRPPRLLLELRLRDGGTCSFPMAPSLVRAPFLLDPLVRDNAEFVAAYPDSGRTPTRVAAFRVLHVPGDDALFAPDFGVSLDARPRPVRTVSGIDPAIAAVAHAVDFPGFEWLPFAAEPADAVRAIGHRELGVHAPAPSELRCRWPGGRRRLVAQFELLPPSYSGLVKTDGATFRIATGEGEDRRTVAERTLQPATVAADRGEQQFTLELDLPAGTLVTLATDPGPSGKDAYDLCAWRGIALEPR